MKNVLLNSVFLLGSFVITQAHASLEYERFYDGLTNSSIGGYTLTDLEVGAYQHQNIGGDNYLLLDSPLDNSTISFNTKHNASSSVASMVHDLDVNSASDVSWWNNNEGFDYDVYSTTDHWIEILLPKNTLAFSFSVGADTAAGSGWFDATDSNGGSFTYGAAGINDNGDYLGTSYSPSFGIYADNSNATAGNCSYVTSVVVDPNFVWGVGNFSIAQGNCSTNIPEPSVLALMSFGLIGVGLVRRKMKK